MIPSVNRLATVLDALAALPEAERRAALEALEPAELATLQWHWPLWARPDQLAPPRQREGLPDWRTWVLLGGRGSGKTRTAAETVRSRVEEGRARHIGIIGIIGPTAETLRRDVVQGPSGLLAVCPPWNMPVHEPSQRRLVWPSGAVAYLLSSEEPNRIRGPNLDYFWGDELTSWTDPEGCWSNLQFALRITGPKGDAPAGIVSTTPKRHALLKAILGDPATVVTRSTTFDNAANLDTETLAYLRRRYDGTTLGRQELMAELLDDAEGALWNRANLDEMRVYVAPEMKRIVVAVDPAGSSNAKADETGIIACGLGVDGRGYVLADASGKYTPDGWARAAVNLYRSLKAD